MKNFALSALVLGASLATALPVASQESFARLGNEAALTMASRINICGGGSIASASFINNGTALQATCFGNTAAAGGAGAGGALTGGLGAAAAVGAGVVAVVAVAASSGGSSSSTTTTN